jgi:hypothetical protein
MKPTNHQPDQQADDDEPRFGGCPTCHRNDGYTNAGRTHVCYCLEHRVSWVIGCNLFSSWKDETEAEQRAAWAAIGLDDFARVEREP